MEPLPANNSFYNIFSYYVRGVCRNDHRCIDTFFHSHQGNTSWKQKSSRLGRRYFRNILHSLAYFYFPSILTCYGILGFHQHIHWFFMARFSKKIFRIFVPTKQLYFSFSFITFFVFKTPKTFCKTNQPSFTMQFNNTTDSSASPYAASAIPCFQLSFTLSSFSYFTNKYFS